MKHKRRINLWTNDYIPEELWQGIMCKLPVKTLVRFRCVSRSWQSLIEHPDFAQLHLTCFKNNRNESHLLIPQGQEHTKCFVRCSKTLKIISRLGFLESDRSSIDTFRTTAGLSESTIRWSIFCSIHGLFILRNMFWGSEVMLWNPSIRKTILLPPSPNICGRINIYTDLGLGFDPLINDYKLVRFVMGVGRSVKYVAVYTLGTNLWKAIRFQGEGSAIWGQYLCLWEETNAICLGGALYTLGSNYGPLSLISFDLSRELFAATSLPSIDNLNRVYCPRSLTLTDGGRALALVALWNNEGSLWVLQRSGDDLRSSSWIRRYRFTTMIDEPHISVPLRRSRSFLFLKSNDEILLKWNMVTSYNLETCEGRVLMKRGLGEGRAWLYVESLLLLTRARNV